MELRTTNKQLGEIAPLYGASWEWENIGPGEGWGPNDTVIVESMDFDQEIHFHDDNAHDWVPPIRSNDPGFGAWLALLRGPPATCKHCGYVWVPRVKKPKSCPRCKQYIR